MILVLNDVLGCHWIKQDSPPNFDNLRPEVSSDFDSTKKKKNQKIFVSEAVIFYSNLF